jgi:hypothetical protein
MQLTRKWIPFFVVMLGIVMSVSAAQAGEKSYYASKQGISVEITKVERKQGKTIIELSMSNHMYDLSQMKVKELSSLTGIKPERYEVKSSRMGGHHVKSEIVFNKELSGLLIIGLSKDLTFEFTL